MRKWPFVVMLVVVLVIALAAVQVFRPVPPIALQATAPATQRVPGQLQIAWPNQGEAALEVAGEGVIGQSGGNEPLPIASLTKMMTAYLVLQAHPLSQGQDGPTLTVTENDVKVYQHDVADGDSVAKVVAGEKLTEYQLLEALLLPSGDNIATMLGNWVSGSTDAFVQKMNETAKTLGMNNSHYSDPAGVDPTTVSTSLDQLKIAEAAMASPVFRDIVAMPQATLPIAGTVYNVDYEVGHHGIVGIKTGSTPQDGANFAFASYATVAGKQVLIIGDVLGQHTVSSLATALNAGVSLVTDAKKNLEPFHVPGSGQSDANVDAAWNAPVATTAPSVTIVGWPGLTVSTSVQSKVLSTPVTSGETVGTLTVRAQKETIQMLLHATEAIPAPTLTWRLERLPSILSVHK